MSVAPDEGNRDLPNHLDDINIITNHKGEHMNNNGDKKPQPQTILSININCMSDQTISVSGFPPNLFQSLDILATAQKAILSHFLNQSKEGKLDDNLSIITSPIITQDKKLVDQTGKPILQ